jgi:hypothetical protein
MKKTLRLTIYTLFSVTAFAQGPIISSDLNPSPGLTYTDNQTTYMAPGSAGANQTWDFSSLTSSGTMTSNVSAATNNGANMLLDNGSSQSYYSFTSTEQELKEVIASGTTITYSNGEKTLQFPLSYNATYSDTFKANFLSNGTYPAVRSGSNTFTVDGYGTLILPNQTVNDVIRIRFQQDYSDTIDIGYPYILNYTSDIYIWYKAGFKSPVLSIVNFVGAGTTSDYGFYTNANNVSIDEVKNIEDVKIYGNPFTDLLTFSVEATKPLEIVYQITDMSGQVVYSSINATLHNGSNKFTIPTNNLKSGAYALKIMNGNQAISKILIRE